MKKASRLVLFIAIALCLLFTGSAWAAAKYKLALGHVEPTKISTHAAALKFKELIEKRTKGAVEVTVHPHSELGAGPDQAQMVQNGAIQMAMLPAGHVATIVPEVQVFTIPFFFPRDVYAMEKLVNGPAGDTLKGFFPKKDIVALQVLVHSPKQFTSNKPVFKPSDFKGQEDPHHGFPSDHGKLQTARRKPGAHQLSRGLHRIAAWHRGRRGKPLLGHR